MPVENSSGTTSIRQISKEEFNRELQKIEDFQNPFIQVRYSLLKFLGGDGSSSVMFSYLLSILLMKKKNGGDKEQLFKNQMWFKLPFNTIKSTLGMGENRTRNCLKKLIEKKLIETEHRTSNYLWVRISTNAFEIISEEITNQKLENQVSRNGETKYQKLENQVSLYNKNFNKNLNNCHDAKSIDDKVCSNSNLEESSQSENNNHSTSIATAVELPPPKTEPIFGETPSISPGKQLAILLHGVLVRHNKIMREVYLNSWAKHFTQLLRFKKFETIKLTIEYHDEHLDETYWPKYYSADTFCANHAKIVDACKRADLEEEKRNGSSDC